MASLINAKHNARLRSERRLVLIDNRQSQIDIRTIAINDRLLHKFGSNMFTFSDFHRKSKLSRGEICLASFTPPANVAS